MTLSSVCVYVYVCVCVCGLAMMMKFDVLYCENEVKQEHEQFTFCALVWGMHV